MKKLQNPLRKLLNMVYNQIMKNFSKVKGAHFIIFLTTLSLLTACGREKLTLGVNAVTINKLRNEQPVNFSYELDKTQIDEYARGTKKFPVFGKLFQAIASVIANSTISSKGGLELDIDEVDVDLHSMGDIDFGYIDWIRFNSLFAYIDDSKNKDSLDFVERVEIYALLEHNTPGAQVDEKGYTRLVYYDRKLHESECSDKCLNLRLENLNWKELIKNNPRLRLRPKIVINSVPRRTMSLVGAVSFSIKFNPGF